MGENGSTFIRIISLVMVLLMIAVIGTVCAGCGNRQSFDTTWSFERAIIFLPDGEKIEGEVTSWRDYGESDMMQVTIEGKTYLTHSSNVVLISE
jgi:hypothetical protein